MNGWALGGLLIFGLFTLLGLGDVVGLVPGLDGIAWAAGLNPDTSLYSAIPSLLSFIIGLGAALTILRVLQGKRQRTAGAARLVGYTFMAYGGFELAMAVFQLGKNPLQMASIGLVFALTGFLVNWLGWRVARAL